MKLVSVKVAKFRSIENGELKGCGDFNVLIGKNNSGKSNVLTAIDAFFDCVKEGSLVTLSPSIGNEIDFFQKSKSHPLEITLKFALNQDDRNDLVTAITIDAPQMKNAVESIGSDLNLSIALSVIPPPNGFGFISSISFEQANDDSEFQHLLLSVDQAAAKEIRSKLALAKKASQDSEAMRKASRNIDEEDWSRLKNSPVDRSSMYSTYRFRIFDDMSPDASLKVESLFRESSSLSDFRLKIDSIVSKLNDDASIAQQEKLKNTVQTFAGNESTIPNYVQNLLTKLAATKILYLKERRKPIGKEEASQLLSLKVKRGGTEVLRNLQENVSNLLGVKIDAFQASTTSGRGEVSAELDVDNFLVEVNGSGVREALRLILDVEFGRPEILLVEEPEVHLHPALETSMMRYLKRISLNIQVFVTTHSTNFLDTAEMKNVYLISRNESTQIQQMNFEEAESQIPKELGIRLSSLFMYDRLVFVEGPSDEAILREWAATLKINFSQANVGFVSMGGVRNFTHYAAEATISFLTKRQVGIWFIIDRDERDETDISALKKLFGERSKIIALDKREIENYLINARAIVEFIKWKFELSGKRSSALPTVNEIETAINDVAETLKAVAINKRVVKTLFKPLFPSREKLFAGEADKIKSNISVEMEAMLLQIQEAKKTLESVYDEESERLNSIWPNERLSLVPGDEVIDLVCKKYGVRYKKEVDGARLASLLNAGEIDKSIKSIINEIASSTGSL